MEETGATPPKPAEEPKKPHKRKRAFPKRQDGTIDKDRVRIQYLASGEIQFTRFCEVFGYRCNDSDLGAFPLRAWRDDAIRKQTEAQDEEVIKDAIAVRKNVLNQRINMTREWGPMARSMREVLKYVAYGYQRAAQHDLRNEKLIDKGEVQAKLTPEAVDAIAKTITAMDKLQALEMRSLLLPPAATAKETLPIPERTAEDTADEAEQQRIGEMGWSVLGMQEKLTTDQLQGIMSKWFDNATAEPPEDAEIVSETPHPENSTAQCSTGNNPEDEEDPEGPAPDSGGWK